jgi:MFS family permease
MFKSILNFVTFLLFFFLFTYEEPASRYGDWVFRYRIYAQILFILLIVRHLLKTGLSDVSKLILNKKFSPYLILIFIPTLFSLLRPDINSLGLRTTVLSFIIFFGAGLFLKNNKHNSFNSILAQFCNAVMVLVIIAFLRTVVDLSFASLNLSKIEFGRLSGWMRSSNYFSIFVAIALIVELHNIGRSKKKSLFGKVKIVAFVLAILFSTSRGTMSTLFFVILINEYNSFRVNGIKANLKRYLLLIPLGLISFLATNENMVSQFNENISRGDIDGAEVLEDPRIELWTLSLVKWNQIDLASKLFGSGRLSSLEFTGRSTHNSYLSALFDYGLIYLIFLIIFVLYLLKISWSLSKYNRIFSLTFNIVLFLVIRSFTNNILGSPNLTELVFNFCIIIILSYNIRQEKDLYI